MLTCALVNITLQSTLKKQQGTLLLTTACFTNTCTSYVEVYS